MSRIITLTITLLLPAWGYSQTLPSIVARGAAVEVERSDGVAESPGATLGAGDSVRTGSASFAVIAFEDGSRVTLGERSEVTISAPGGLDGMTAVRLENGSVRARSGHSAVRIETPAGDFTLSELPAEAEFALTEGKVTVYVASGGLETANLDASSLVFRGSGARPARVYSAGSIEGYMTPPIVYPMDWISPQIYVADPQYGFPIYTYPPAQINPPGPR